MLSLPQSPSAPTGGLEPPGSGTNLTGVLEFDGQRAPSSPQPHPLPSHPSKPFGSTFQGGLFIKQTHEINPMERLHWASQVTRLQVNSTYFQQAGARTAMHHSDLHSRRTRFPSLRASCFLGGSAAPSARGSSGLCQEEHLDTDLPARKITQSRRHPHHRLGTVHRAPWASVVLRAGPALQSLAGSDK